MKALRIILASIKRADNDFNLFKNNTSICVGISGGKDSMALFYCLNLYKRYSNLNFKIYPMIINLGFPNNDLNNIKNYFASLGYNLHVENCEQVYQILKIQQKRQKLDRLPCSICSKMKKAIINKVAEKLNCDHVSFAHHKDDAIETLILNEIYGGRIATFSPKMYLTNAKMTFIRPFIYVSEKDIQRLIREENIPVFPSTCPNDKHTERENIKNLLNKIYKDYPTCENNFLTMLNNHSKLDLFFNHFERKIAGTNYFYKEVNDIDSFIDEMHFLKRKNLPKKELKHIHIYKNNSLFGVLNILENNRKFTINLLKLRNYSEIEKIFFHFYNDYFSKYNPLEFEIILTSEVLKLIVNIPYNYIKKLGAKHLISITINPAKISKILK